LLSYKREKRVRLNARIRRKKGSLWWGDTGLKVGRKPVDVDGDHEPSVEILARKTRRAEHEIVTAR
jgi:hypothetical protein